MKLKLLISDFSNTPVRYYLPKILSQIKDKLQKRRILKIDLNHSSFSLAHSVNWNASFLIEDFLNESNKKSFSPEVCKKYLNHEFDYLGSGWMSHSMNVSSDYDEEGIWLKGRINSSNENESKKIWKEIRSIRSDYCPISWHTDIKSSFEFSSSTHFSKVKTIVNLDGVDVKLPWELARLQHLPELALAACSDQSSMHFQEEVQCQLLDFIMSNPPRWGIHWASAMEVSIRMMNMVAAVNLLVQKDAEIIKSNFFKYFVSSIQDHLTHAWEFREHKNGLGNNHYLANLTGVLYGAYSTIEIPVAKDILSKALAEMLKEIDKQFLEDGGNFESSLTYHCFSSEIAVLALSLMSRIKLKNALDFDSKLQTMLKVAEDKLSKSLELIEWVKRGDGLIPQIGDNDSARLLYWNYPFEMKNDEPIRESLNYSSSIDMLKGYFDEEASSIHGDFIKAIRCGEQSIRHIRTTEFEIANREHGPMQFSENTFYDAPELNLLKNIRSKAFPSFGIYTFKNDDLYLLVNGTNRHVAQYWPHGHNDKLSFELWLRGKPIVQDPGSYSYTGFPDLRNKYRSIQAHATAVFGEEEQNSWTEGIAGVFRMEAETVVELLHLTENSIKLKVSYRKFSHVREIEIQEKGIAVRDWGNFPFRVIKHPEIAFSNGYGKIDA